MIIVEGWVRLEDTQEVDRLRAAAIEMMRATKTQEPGCLEYAYAIDVSDQALLRIIERWTDEAALSAHFATPHMAVFGNAMASAKIAAVSIKAYSGEVIRTLMER
ncbi:MAG: putative quinol monooxygenase [Hyphomonadaceae bacterium]|nr:putative quinol monooxygenase [Hyphomonadaceae bacterium]